MVKVDSKIAAVVNQTGFKSHPCE